MGPAYVIAAILAVIGAIAIGSGILMGVSQSSNYVVETGFGAFALAAAIFLLYFLIQLVRDFRETA